MVIISWAKSSTCIPSIEILYKKSESIQIFNQRNMLRLVHKIRLKTNLLLPNQHDWPQNRKNTTITINYKFTFNKYYNDIDGICIWYVKVEYWITHVNCGWKIVYKWSLTMDQNLTLIKIYTKYMRHVSSSEQYNSWPGTNTTQIYLLIHQLPQVCYFDFHFILVWFPSYLYYNIILILF